MLEVFITQFTLAFPEGNQLWKNMSDSTMNWNVVLQEIFKNSSNTSPPDCGFHLVICPPIFPSAHLFVSIYLFVCIAWSLFPTTHPLSEGFLWSHSAITMRVNKSQSDLFTKSLQRVEFLRPCKWCSKAHTLTMSLCKACCGSVTLTQPSLWSSPHERYWVANEGNNLRTADDTPRDYCLNGPLLNLPKQALLYNFKWLTIWTTFYFS